MKLSIITTSIPFKKDTVAVNKKSEDKKPKKGKDPRNLVLYAIIEKNIRQKSLLMVIINNEMNFFHYIPSLMKHLSFYSC